MGADEEWTIKALKEHLERIFEEREKRWDDQHIATRLAVQKAESALEHRLDLLNEFRQQSVDEQARFATKDEFDALEKRYEDKHGPMELRVSLLEARVIPMLWVGSTLVVALVGVFLSHILAGKP